MKRPGTRIRAIAKSLCNARTMERFVDPTIADLQSEYEEAVNDGRTWERARIWIAGHIAVIQVIALHGGLKAMDIPRDLTDDDRRAVLRTILASTVIAVIGTLVLAMIPVKTFATLFDLRRALELSFYLIPGALPISIPIGLTFGTLWGLRRMWASRRTRMAVLLLAFGASLASFATLAWVMPASNQAFRVSMLGRPLPKGPNELTIGELRQRLATPSDSPSLALAYHARWALGSAPFFLAVFALTFTSRRQWSRAMLVLSGVVMFFIYYVVMSSARGLGLDQTIPPIAAAWAPNLAFVMLSLVIMKFTAPRASGVAA
jgi:hypothetical protein